VPDPPGAFAAIRPSHLVARDLAAVAVGEHLGRAGPVVSEAAASPNPGGWPKGGQTVVSFRNPHLSYAVTWFGLAIALLCI
jgi:surfeit locus 1 family protein